MKVTPVAVGTTTLTATSSLGTTTIPVYVGEMPLAAVTSEHVGFVICSNGCVCKPTNPEDGTSALGCGHTKVAIIAHVGATGTVDYSTTVDGSKYRGLAIAMADWNSSGTCQWYTANSGTHVAQNSTIGTVLGAPAIYMKGIDFTNTLADGCGAEHTHAAATNAKNWQYTGAENAGDHPSGTSQWFLPAIGQWNLIVQGLTGLSTNLTTSTNNSYKNAAFDTILGAAGGDAAKFQAGNYWSSVEYSTSGAWYMYFGNGGAHYDGKSANNRVRPVLAF